MEAIAAAASVTGLIHLITTVSDSATCFMRDVKDARKDMIQVRRDMSDLSAVLIMVAEDADPTPHGQENIIGIVKSCCKTLSEIDSVIQQGRSWRKWAVSGKEKVDKLRARLETHKMTLDLALDYRTMVVVKDIKEDSTRTQDGISAIQRDIELLLAKVNDVDQRVWTGQESLDRSDFPDGGVMLDRFLSECRSDAKTVLDSIGYQQDQDFEYVPPQAKAGAAEPATSSVPQTVLVKNTRGHVLEIPLEKCRTSLRIEELIRNSYPEGSDDRKEIEDGQYTMYNKGQLVPLESWDDVVGPGLCVVLKLWTSDSIQFLDALGRRFKFPWNIIRTWNGMEETLNKAFTNVENTGPDVEAGHYDLVGPDDTIMLPSLWEYFIRPGMFIRMRMWPMDKHPLPHSPSPMAHLTAMRIAAAKVAAAGAGRARPPPGLGIPPPSLSRLPPGLPRAPPVLPRLAPGIMAKDGPFHLPGPFPLPTNKSHASKREGRKRA